MASLAIISVAASRMSARTTIRNYFKAVHTSATTGKFFTKKHEWISVSDNIGTVGISKYAQEALGEVVYCQLPAVGTELQAAQECAALESVKAASEIYSPVSGTVIEKNDAVESSPSLINTACYEGGWLFRVRLSKTDDLDQLMTHAAYEEFLLNHEEH